jgi:hypothetical protein
MLSHLTFLNLLTFGYYRKLTHCIFLSSYIQRYLYRIYAHFSYLSVSLYSIYTLYHLSLSVITHGYHYLSELYIYVDIHCYISRSISISPFTSVSIYISYISYPKVTHILLRTFIDILKTYFIHTACIRGPASLLAYLSHHIFYT